MWMWSTTMPGTGVRDGSSRFKFESPKVFNEVAPQTVSNQVCIPLVGRKEFLDSVGALFPAYPANYHPFLCSTRLPSPPEVVQPPSPRIYVY